ncbi:MAG: hypothetical protein GW878_02405 [Acidobacteria bacterium]|nr:hypothetical protein [Acidobacteriota bacterium]
MRVLPQGVQSTFQFILIAAKRAEQLIAGARPRLVTHTAKPTTTALAEVEQNLVPWHLVTATEFEQLRLLEIAAREREEHTPLFPAPAPIIPPVVEPEIALDEDEELDDDLEETPDLDLDEVDGPPAEALLTEEVCEKCGAPMVKKPDGPGNFIMCSTFPECKYVREIAE